MLNGMKDTLNHAWPLLLGMFLIMIGNGLQGTLLGVRAGLEGFPVYVTGIIMSLYYVGFWAGCNLAPKMIHKVGHIRVFAALASLASSTILLHGLFPNPALWALVRIFSGISFAGLFIAAESWLNRIVTKELRGLVFSAYLLVVNFGLFGGQFLMNLGPAGNMGLFILVSILISLSLVPVTLADRAPPGYVIPEKKPLWDILKISPLAVTGVMAAGICSSGMLGLGPAYAQSIGMDVKHISWLMSAFILGAAVIPPAIGWISDRIDRRLVIVILSIAGFVCCASINYVSGWLYIPVFLTGGFGTTLYSLSIAYMNDQIEHDQMVTASAALILMNATGACFGPILIGLTLHFSGNPALFYPALSTSFLMIGFVGIVRMILNPRTINVARQTRFIVLPQRSGQMLLRFKRSLNPKIMK